MQVSRVKCYIELLNTDIEERHGPSYADKISEYSEIITKYRCIFNILSVSH